MIKIYTDGFNVYLKTLCKEDTKSLAIIANDYEIAFNIANLGSFPYPYKISSAKSFIDFASKAFDKEAEFHFGIFLSNTNQILGVIGLKNLDQHISSAEIGYWIGRQFWNKGYASESIKLILFLGFEYLAMNKLWGKTFYFNKASQRVMENGGLRRDGILREIAFITKFKAGYKEFIEYTSRGIDEGRLKTLSSRLNLESRIIESWNRRFVLKINPKVDIDAGDVYVDEVLYSILKKEYQGPIKIDAVIA